MKRLAFTFQGKETLYDGYSGHELPNEWEGYCLVFFRDGHPLWFHTGINQFGERYWWAYGNDPDKGENKYEDKTV